MQEGPSQPILCLGPVPLCEDSSPTKVDDLSCALPTFECSVLSLTCIEETIQKDAFVCGKSLLSSEQFPSLTTLQTTHQVELLSWSLWAIVLLFLFLRFERWLYHRSFGYAPVSVAEYSVALAFASNQRGLRIRHILHSLLLALTVTAILLAIFSYYEGTKAEHLDVDVTIAERTLALSCTTPVDLGTFIGNGDSGTQSDDHSTLCTVFTTNTSGYALKWQMIAPSSGSGTGSLLSASGDAIPSLLSSTPVTWPAFGSGVTEQWGARLASKSTTVDTSVWGIDGASELWSRVGTGSTTIALRNDATSIAGDQQTIGFRAAIDSSINKPAGTYSASILFSAVAP